MKTVFTLLAAILFFNENALARTISFAESYSVPSSLYKRHALRHDRDFHQVRLWTTSTSSCVLTAHYLMFEKVIPEYEAYSIQEETIDFRQLAPRSYELVFKASSPFRPFAKPGFAPTVKVSCRFFLWNQLSLVDAFRNLPAIMPVLIQN